MAQDEAPYFVEVFSVLEERIVPRLIERLPTDEMAVVADIDLVLIEDPFIVSAIFTEKNTKTIYYYLGFIDGLFQYIDCMLLLPVRPNRESCSTYFEYYFDHILSNDRTPPSPYAVRVLSDKGEIEKWYEDEEYNAARNQMLLSALIQVTMHELGHHVVGFPAPGMSVHEYRMLEGHVDRWSMDRLAQIGEPPVLGAIIALGYVSQMERFRRVKGAMSFSTHPMPRERAEYAYSLGCVDLASEAWAKPCAMLREILDTFE